MNERQFLVTENKVRLDFFLAKHTIHSRNTVKQFIKESCVTVNAKVVTKASYTLNHGHELILIEPEINNDQVSFEKVPLDFLFEDDHLVIVYKPAGLLTHGIEGSSEKSLVDDCMDWSNP